VTFHVVLGTIFLGLAKLLIRCLAMPADVFMASWTAQNYIWMKSKKWHFRCYWVQFFLRLAKLLIKGSAVHACVLLASSTAQNYILTKSKKWHLTWYWVQFFWGFGKAFNKGFGSACGRAFGILNCSKLHFDENEKVTFHVVLGTILFEFGKALN
jgi:hypothetical protein